MLFTLMWGSVKNVECGKLRFGAQAVPQIAGKAKVTAPQVVAELSEALEGKHFRVRESGTLRRGVACHANSLLTRARPLRPGVA
ncbi:hypothetical protein [Massilia frigida]|uniref:hypothetical protein n=1 Tax=Massilia frigida TaxID=2609281 RepID=UPI001424129A|nr:hypothetical protein [Massilia frigida]